MIDLVGGEGWPPITRDLPAAPAPPLPAHVEAGLRSILGIPTNRVEALRRLVALLREARVLATETDADHGGTLVSIEGAIYGTQRDLDREEARRLAAAVYHPEAM